MKQNMKLKKTINTQKQVCTFNHLCNTWTCGFLKIPSKITLKC